MANKLGTPQAPEVYSTVDAAIAAAANYALVWAQVGTVIYRITSGGRVVIRVN